MDFSKEMDAAVEAAKEAGRVLMSHYGKAHARVKPDHSLVTEADLEAEKVIRSVLEAGFPGYSFLGEETGLTDRESDHTWIVDPLDGTTNYTIRDPLFCTSIALAFKKEPVMGVVYYPTADELFQAERDAGALLDGKAIKVSEKEKVEDSVLTFCHGRDPETVGRIADIFSSIKQITTRFRQMGAANLELCFVAAGRTEAYLMPGVNSWDVAAGAIIVREAGGKVTDFQGRPYELGSKDLLATNGWVHNQLLTLL